MEIGPGSCVLITGAGSGIGRALALDFASKGASVSIVDCVEENGLKTLEAIKEEHFKLQLNHELPAGLFLKCDVTNYEDVKDAFDEHKKVYGKLDVCINCAGIGERRFSVMDDEQSSWRAIIEVNLNSVIECTRRAIQLMKDKGPGKAGVIVNLASAAGLVPSDFPVYSASKAGVILFTRSLSNLAAEGIRVNVLCPELVATPMTDAVPKEIIDSFGGFIPMEKVVEATMELVENFHAGDCLWLSCKNGPIYVPAIPKLA